MAQATAEAPVAQVDQPATSSQAPAKLPAADTRPAYGGTDKTGSPSNLRLPMTPLKSVPQVAVPPISSPPPPLVAPTSPEPTPPSNATVSSANLDAVLKVATDRGEKASAPALVAQNSKGELITVGIGPYGNRFVSISSANAASSKLVFVDANLNPLWGKVGSRELSQPELNGLQNEISEAINDVAAAIDSNGRGSKAEGSITLLSKLRGQGVEQSAPASAPPKIDGQPEAPPPNKPRAAPAPQPRQGASEPAPQTATPPGATPPSVAPKPPEPVFNPAQPTPAPTRSEVRVDSQTFALPPGTEQLASTIVASTGTNQWTYPEVRFNTTTWTIDPAKGLPHGVAIAVVPLQDGSGKNETLITISSPEIKFGTSFRIRENNIVETRSDALPGPFPREKIAEMLQVISGSSDAGRTASPK